jgi:excinuclease ABC subunit C
MRNEAHRFGITHHRDKRSKNAIDSELSNIPGIGPKTITQLLQKFKTVSAIKSLTSEELKKEVGQSKAEIILDYFQNN